MKKAFLTLLAVIALGFAASAQSNTIGLRLGGGSATNAEISYQQALGGNRMEFDFGWNNFNSGTNLNLSATYQWVFPIIGGLDWYIGPGAMLSLYSVQHEPSLGVGVGGQLGIEYTFRIPLTLSLDARPMWNFIGYANNWGGVALGIRYNL